MNTNQLSPRILVPNHMYEYEWVMSHVWIRISHVIAQVKRYEWDMPHMWRIMWISMTLVTHMTMNESCHTYAMDESYHTYEYDSADSSHLAGMGWLRLVGSLKLQVSFAKEPYKRHDILQKRPMILRSLLTAATPCSSCWLIPISQHDEYHHAGNELARNSSHLAGIHHVDWYWFQRTSQHDEYHHVGDELADFREPYHHVGEELAEISEKRRQHAHSYIMLAMNCQFIAIEATLYQSLRFQRSAANMIANVVTHIHRQHNHDSFIFIANMSHDSFIFIANMIMLAMNWLSTIMPHVWPRNRQSNQPNAMNWLITMMSHVWPRNRQSKLIRRIRQSKRMWLIRIGHMRRIMSHVWPRIRQSCHTYEYEYETCHTYEYQWVVSHMRVTSLVQWIGWFVFVRVTWLIHIHMSDMSHANLHAWHDSFVFIRVTWLIRIFSHVQWIGSFVFTCVTRSFVFTCVTRLIHSHIFTCVTWLTHAHICDTTHSCSHMWHDSFIFSRVTWLIHILSLVR